MRMSAGALLRMTLPLSDRQDSPFSLLKAFACLLYVGEAHVASIPWSFMRVAMIRHDLEDMCNTFSMFCTTGPVLATSKFHRFIDSEEIKLLCAAADAGGVRGGEGAAAHEGGGWLEAGGVVSRAPAAAARARAGARPPSCHQPQGALLPIPLSLLAFTRQHISSNSCWPSAY